MSRLRIQFDGSLPCDPALLFEAMEELFPKKEFLPFEDAREFVRNLNLKSGRDWRLKYCKSSKKPDNIPCDPRTVYKNKGWKNWSDFLGSYRLHHNDFLSFEECKQLVRKLCIKGRNEWQEYCRLGKPNNVPFAPCSCYKDEGWNGWGDFSGTGNTREKDFVSYGECKQFVRKLGIKTFKEWVVYYKSGKRPEDIPANPYKIYEGEWISWGDFLGTGSIGNGNRIFVSYEKSKQFVRKLGIKTNQEWVAYCKSGKRPNNVPSNFNKIYKDEWISWGDFLGTGFLSIDQSKEIVKSFNLKGSRAWREFCNLGKKPNNIPSSPKEYYKNKGWISWPDFLGN
jgi:hypothetical protein